MQQLQYIVIGDLQSPLFTFEGDAIMSTNGDLSVDMIGAEFCTDVMEAEVSYDDTNGTLRALPWATPVYFYRGEHLEGMLYSVNVTRTGRKAYRIRTTSAAGIMDYEKFYGGIYNREHFKTVVESIFGSNGLQPYAGVYRRFFRVDDTHSGIRGIGMGAYSNEKYPEESNDAAFLSATMSSKLSAKVKILGFLTPSNALYSFDWHCSILGADTLHGEIYAESVKKYRYGLYMYVTRTSTDVPFPSFGEVFFVYGPTEISLGTPASASEAIYEIDVDPGAGTAVINGVTYAITLDTSIANALCPLHVYGGGATIAGKYASGERYEFVGIHNCKLEVFYYTIKDSGGNLQSNYVGVRDDINGSVDVYEYVTHKRQQNVPNSEVLATDLEPYDVSTHGEYPIFNNRTAFEADVLAKLSYADGIDTLLISGWLPICSKREALQQLLFATGVILIKDENGEILFTAPSEQSVGDIDDDDIYDKGSEDQPDHVNLVGLTEHSFVLDTSSQAETIYETDIGVTNGYYIAAFSNAPAMLEESNGLTCLCSNCNAAVLIGAGSITGYLYSHTEKVLRREIATFPDGRGVNVSDATLITLLNSESVMDRLEAYYSFAHKTRVDIAQNGERCGLMYTLTSAFGEPFSGFLVRASKVITSIVRAACEFVLGYTPPHIGNSYANYVILTGSGTWTVPTSVFEAGTPRIRVVLIGGGRGGDGGYAGEDGMQPQKGEGATPADGGAPGDSGSGGKIFEVTITNPAASYAYSCGQGGAGGATSNSHNTNNPGSDGGNTTLSGGGQNYSSESGAPSEIGIINVFTGDRYAGRLISRRTPGNSEANSGGAGGYRSAEYYGSAYHPAVTCNKYIMDTWLDDWQGGGEGGEYRSNGWLRASGGGGGGAGYGQNGSSGSAATYSGGVYRSGNGGKGGDATETPPKATDYNPTFYGYGGLGGGGGGGGGAGGWVLSDTAAYSVGTGGAGGYGGRGGDGGDGCVLIYY